MSLLTRGCDSVLPGGLVIAQCEQQGLDGSDEDPSQAAVEDDIEQQNFDCEGEKKKKKKRCVSAAAQRETGLVLTVRSQNEKKKTRLRYAFCNR